MKNDASLWHNLEENLEQAAVDGLRPGLAGRVLAEAGRQRRARALRQIPQAMVLAGLAAVLAAGGYLAGLQHLATQRAQDWAQVAAWTQDYEVD